MKIGYTGSRHLGGGPVIDAIRSLYMAAELGNAVHHDHVLGDAPTGVDQVVAERLRLLDLEPQIEEAEWTRYGRAAGPIRNTEIVVAADVLLAVWDGESKGTLNTITQANAKPIPVYVRVLPRGTGCECKEHRGQT